MQDFYFLPKQKIAVSYLSNFKAKIVLLIFRPVIYPGNYLMLCTFAPYAKKYRKTSECG